MAREKEYTHYVLWCVSRLGGELHVINNYFYERLARYVRVSKEESCSRSCVQLEKLRKSNLNSR